jgi:hypothetical protein
LRFETLIMLTKNLAARCIGIIFQNRNQCQSMFSGPG